MTVKMTVIMFWVWTNPLTALPNVHLSSFGDIISLRILLRFRFSVLAVFIPVRIGDSLHDRG
jgi:hypothetical protein